MTGWRDGDGLRCAARRALPDSPGAALVWICSGGKQELKDLLQ